MGQIGSHSALSLCRAGARREAPLKSTATVRQPLALAWTPPVPSTRLTETMGRRNHHNVYVIELSKDVLHERRFKKCNPGYIPGKPCLYVGMTGLDPDVRFDNHKAGIRANNYVQKYGLRLLPELYELYNPMTYNAARDLEVELAIDFREAGYGVWQA